MFITKDLLQEKGACQSGTRWFLEKFPNGVDYQDLLNALAAENNIEWAQWVLQNFGKLNAVMEVEELTIEGSLFFAGTVIVKGKMKISKWLLAGEGIKAGLGIEAGEDIKAGEDFGIYAGLRLKISHKKRHAIIKAKGCPENIICGEFVEV